MKTRDVTYAVGTFLILLVAVPVAWIAALLGGELQGAWRKDDR